MWKNLKVRQYQRNLLHAFLRYRTPLHLSIKNSNTSIFELLLKKADKYLLEIKDVHGLPPMWYALEKLQESDEKRIYNQIHEPEYFSSELIKAGASPNSVSKVNIWKANKGRCSETPDYICKI